MNPKTKVYFNGKLIQPNQYTRFQRIKMRVKYLFKTLAILIGKMSLIATVIVLIFTAGQWSVPEHISAQTITQTEEFKAPVLERIAGCESEGNPKSKGSHYGKDGQVRTNANPNGTVDIGKNQINQKVWGKKATELGYDLFVEKDNDAMAKWLYLNYGTEPWYSSEKCWKY